MQFPVPVATVAAPPGSPFQQFPVPLQYGSGYAYPGMRQTPSFVRSDSLSCSTRSVGLNAALHFRSHPPPVFTAAMAPGFAAPCSPSFPSAGPRQESTQESESLENLKPRYADTLAGSGTDHVRVVSMGMMCGVKLSFQQLGRGAETLPFDWTRTRLKGILHFLRNDFEGFFDYQTVKPNCGEMTMYRSQHHSFWHDNPDDPAMRERYTRRIERFKAIDARGGPVLFVRAIASTEELKNIAELLHELTDRFGEQTHLLIIVDFQKRMQGPVVVDGLPGNILFYYHRNQDRQPAFAPYLEPIRVGLRWAAGKSVEAKSFGSMQEVIKATDRTDWGYTAHGNVRSFEDQPAQQQARARSAAPLRPQQPAQQQVAQPHPCLQFSVPARQPWLQNPVPAMAYLPSGLPSRPAPRLPMTVPQGGPYMVMVR